ncbi:MAG TPA: hypothetical protein VHV99_15875 [Paraburkholderia sp.]|jgi:hypothetical protein|nr:hypothetical protein [Paraburkholderia sp.]
MDKLFTYLQSDENYTRVLKWHGAVIIITGISMLAMFMFADFKR